MSGSQFSLSSEFICAADDNTSSSNPYDNTEAAPQISDSIHLLAEHWWNRRRDEDRVYKLVLDYIWGCLVSIFFCHEEVFSTQRYHLNSLLLSQSVGLMLGRWNLVSIYILRTPWMIRWLATCCLQLSYIIIWCHRPEILHPVVFWHSDHNGDVHFIANVQRFGISHKRSFDHTYFKV
jgi:hypothetical protein